MTQPTEKRFVMEPRLDAEVAQINDALDDKVDLTDPRLTDERVPLDNSVTSAKIANGAIVDEDVNASAAIAKTKIAGTAVTQADTGTVTSTMIANGTVTGTDIASGTVTEANLAALDYVKFDTTYAGGSTQPGMLAWDQANETLQFQLDPHVTLQVGQEHVMRVKNASGTVAIPERTVVMFAGATGDTIKVSPAVSDGSVNVNYLAGITTEEIPADGFGFVTQLGFINHTNTNGWAVGTILYADPTVAGGLTPTEPELPAWTMPVAAVTKKSTSAGRMLVRAIPGGSGAGGSSVVISDTVPAGGTKGDLWLDSTEGTLYIYFEDADSSQWVQVKANSALEGSILERLGALESQAIAYGRPSYNYVINGAFDIWQRSTSTSTLGWASADRFWVNNTAGTTTIAREASILPTGFQYSQKLTQSVANAQVVSFQTVETNNVIPLRGKIVTLSAYVYATTSQALSLDVQFSTSIDNPVTGTWTTITPSSGGTGTASATWQRVIGTFTIPSNASTLRVGLNITSLTSGQSFYWTGVQLEEGSVATAFRRNANSIQGELAACQRYYWRWDKLFGLCHYYTASQTYIQKFFPVPMRTAPPSLGFSSPTGFIVYAAAGSSTSTSVVFSDSSNTMVEIALVTGSRAAGIAGHVAAVNGSQWMEVSAEL